MPIYVPIVTYGLRVVVYKIFNMILQWLSWSSMYVQSFISEFSTVFEICELKLKKKTKKNNNKMKNCENEILQF